MNYKVFIRESDEILGNMSMDELRSCVYGIARKVPENKREAFIRLLDDCRTRGTGKEKNVISCRKLMQDEKVRNKLGEIKKSFAKISDGELHISAEDYEDYSAGFWESDWIWEYKDNEGIGEIIADAALFAHDCMNDCRYGEAMGVFKLVIDTQIPVEDETGGDSFELSLKEMVDEGLTRVNLNTLALDVLYTEYQLQPPDKRAAGLYSYFSYFYFKDVHIEGIFSVGKEELQDTDMFFRSWIDFLIGQKGDTAARLLKEGILYYKGAEGLLEEAGKCYKEHPGLYLAALSEYEKSHDYEEMKKIGEEAMDKLGDNLKIRSEIAIKTAQASACVNDRVFMIKCWYEAFASDSTAANFLRLFTDKEAVKSYKALAEKRIGELRVLDDYCSVCVSETAENTVSEMEYKYLCFFSGHFDKVKGWCMEQKNPLGWSGKFIGRGVDLILLYLYEGNNLEKAGREIADRISVEIGLKENKNLIFIRENSIFETDAGEQGIVEVFWNVFRLWKEEYVITQQEKKSYTDWLESVIDGRIGGILGGKYRKKYEDVALLAVALGEVKESSGDRNAKKTIIDKYLVKYSRRPAFKVALKEYMD